MMGMEKLCGACGAPIGLNQMTYSLGGYCASCSQSAQQTQAQMYQDAQRSDRHDWQRSTPGWFACKHCGGMVSDYHDAAGTRFGCTAAKRQEWASSLWTTEKEVKGETIREQALIEHDREDK